MNALIASLLVALPLATLASPIADLICHMEMVRTVSPTTLKILLWESSDTYRFTNQKLYLKSSDRDEYLYGSVAETELGRYVVGHKTIIVEDPRANPLVIQVTHVNSTEVHISSAVCRKQCPPANRKGSEDGS